MFEISQFDNYREDNRRDVILVNEPEAEYQIFSEHGKNRNGKSLLSKNVMEMQRGQV